ncbi:MAG: ATP-binding protein [Chloroflexi bacterium]|nr:ATP-binding protein [Chloroflexota bacterium]
MISLLSKPPDQFDVSDLHELIDSQVPEGQQIEFKADPRTDCSLSDRWISGGRPIRERARNKILEEAVAFANAYGGAVVLGIVESESRPPVADRICPIHRCAELAEQLKHAFRDCVDPQIPGLEVIAIPTDGDDGVVVIRVGKSRSAPHRVEPTRHCTIRRSDRCDNMAMREIQDLTLNLSRGLESLERRLKRRSERFPEELERLNRPDQAYGIRATAAPVGDAFHLDRVIGEERLYEQWRSLSIVDGERTTRLQFPRLEGSWRPMLRSARNEYYGGDSNLDIQIYREIHSDGLLEIGIVNCFVVEQGGVRGPRIYPDWPLTVFANLLVWADRVRNQASAPVTEYAVDVEIYVRCENLLVVDYTRDYHVVPNYVVGPDPSSVRYPGDLLGSPRYSLGAPSEVAGLIALFERDFWNSIGGDVGRIEHHFEIEDWDERN